MIHEVKDGVRTLQFMGDKLAHSTSRRYGKPRWVEFDLYKTQSNQYVISRVGYSLTYHSERCDTVARNHLQPVEESKIPGAFIPCSTCKPQRLDPEELLFPEKERPWAQVSQTPQGVVESLMKYDDNKVEYLTDVARELLQQAAVVDPGIRNAFMVTIID